MAGRKRKSNALTEFLDFLDYQGDRRSADAVKLRKIRKGLKQRGNEALLELFTYVISHNLLIEKKIVDKLLEDNNLVNKTGDLNPVVSKDLMKLRSNTLQYLKMLQSIKSKSGGKDTINLEDLIHE